MDKDLLRIENLHTHFFTPEGIVHAVNGVDLTVKKGHTLGIVGESGCGKTVLALSIMRLIQDPPGKITSGRIFFEGHNLLDIDETQMLQIRGNRISMIFQEPMTSLNPVFTIGSQIAEVIELHQLRGKRSGHLTKKKTEELLRLVGIPDAESRMNDYPHQMSGGMCQRVMIAMALACRPELMIADEPTTALDVTTQSQILSLIDALKKETGMSVIMVTHDLGIVAQTCQDVAVMYAGNVVEHSRVEEIFSFPMHPYTKGLMLSVPKLGIRSRDEKLHSIDGTVPRLTGKINSCTFNTRCPEVMDICRNKIPPEIEVSPGHMVKCWRYT